MPPGTELSRTVVSALRLRAFGKVGWWTMRPSATGAVLGEGVDEEGGVGIWVRVGGTVFSGLLESHLCSLTGDDMFGERVVSDCLELGTDIFVVWWFCGSGGGDGGGGERG